MNFQILLCFSLALYIQGKSAKGPSAVTLLSDVSRTSDSPTVHAFCTAEHFYPGFLEIKWSMAGESITDGVTSGQAFLNNDGSYSTSSILSISCDLLSANSPLKCSVNHESSGSKVERCLESCQGE